MIASYSDIAGIDSRLEVVWVCLRARYSMMRRQVSLIAELQAEASLRKHSSNESPVEWLVEHGYLVLSHPLSLGMSYGSGTVNVHLRFAGPSHYKIVVCVTLRFGVQRSAFDLASQTPVADLL